MADLISRAAAIDAIVSVTSFPDVDSIKSIYNIGNGEEWVDGVYDAINAVEEVNAVDAAPVVHGRWIDIPDKPEWDQKMCSICGDYRCCQGNYCPNCGAKMDGEE
jgi:hypothetical protein